MLDATLDEFFPKQYGNNTMSELGCEPQLKCDGNSACFKGILSNSLTFAITIVPGEDTKILPKLKGSAAAAAKQCSGGSDGKTCGQRWYQPNWDGSSGLEQQISALSVISGSLVTGPGSSAPKSSNSGGTSQSDPNAGTGSGNGGSGGNSKGPELKPITPGDRAGASILTVVFLAGWIGGTVWLIVL